MQSPFTFYRCATLLVSLAVTLVACGKKPPPAPPPPNPKALERQVDIVAWPGYLERGATDRNYDWVTRFEAERRTRWSR